MQSTVKERLIKFIKYKQLSQKKFEQIVGLSNGYVNNISKSLGASKLAEISQHYPDLNQQWLLTGEGEMLKTSEAVPFTPHARARIPLVSQYAHAGYLCGYGDPEYLGALPTIDFTPDREMTGNWLAFEVKGDSMDNGSKESYVEGEIVICREVEPEYWRDSRLFINKRDFVIVHEEGILIKRITEHNVEAHTITIHSLNPMYPDRTLNLEQVHQIFSIVESRVQRRR